MSLFACDACDRVYLTDYESLGLTCPYCDGGLRGATREEAMAQAARSCTPEARETPAYSAKRPLAVGAHRSELRLTRAQVLAASAQAREQSTRLIAKGRTLLGSSHKMIGRHGFLEAAGEVYEVDNADADEYGDRERDDEVYFK